MEPAMKTLAVLHHMHTARLLPETLHVSAPPEPKTDCICGVAIENYLHMHSCQTLLALCHGLLTCRVEWISRISVGVFIAKKILDHCSTSP